MLVTSASLETNLANALKDLRDTSLQSKMKECELESHISDKDAKLQVLQAQLFDSERSLAELMVEHQALRSHHDEKEFIMEKKLQEMEESLKQKDDDLREARRSVKRIHGDTSEQLLFERRRGQKLEEDNKALRGSEAKSRDSLRETAHELANSRVENKALVTKNTELRQALKTVAGERDKLVDLAAERDQMIASQHDEFATLQHTLEERQREYEIVLHTFEAKCREADQLARDHVTLETEFASYRELHGEREVFTDLRSTVNRLAKLGDAKQADFDAQQSGIGAVDREYILVLEKRLAAADQARRDTHNAMQELKGSIRVFCRIRPPPDAAVQSLDVEGGDKISLSVAGELYSFGYDKVFGISSSQTEIFNEVSGLVQSAMDGYKVCIFAYGQTGSGKTLTMQGTSHPSQWGIIPRSLCKIFESSRAMMQEGWSWSVQCCFFEVYNESFRDLLGNNGGSVVTPSSAHVIKHDDVWGSIVTNMTTVEVTSLDQIQDLMARAAKHRSVGATDINAQSSRSHAVFALYLTGTNEKSNCKLHGALHLVDLAGSERLGKSGSTGDRLKETQNINRSLSSLVDVFVAKSERRSHVPFRNSKLTHLMEPCFSGHGKTLMLVNVCSDENNAPETLCSLRFASQVNQCNTGGKAKRSVKNLRDHCMSPPPSQRGSYVATGRMTSVSPPPIRASTVHRMSSGRRNWYPH